MPLKYFKHFGGHDDITASHDHKTGRFSDRVAKVEPSQSLSSPIFPEALHGMILRQCWAIFSHLMQVGS